MTATEFAGTTYTSIFAFSSTLDLANHTAVDVPIDCQG